MNIVVCIKQVLDTDGPVEINRQTGSVETRGMYYVVNPLDMLAVEEAVRIKEKQNAGHVTIVCMGPSSAVDALRHCLSMGADRAMLLCDSAFNQSDSYATGVILAKAISALKYDLIMCGQKAADTEAGQVGAVIADILQAPLVSGVTKIDFSPDCSKVTAHRKVERGNMEVVETALPAVVTVETGLNSPRYPSLRSRIAAQRTTIEEYDMQALGLSARDVGSGGSKIKVLNISTPRPKPRKLFTPDSSFSAAERMRLVISGGISEKSGPAITGNPEALASELIKFLVQQKLIS